MRITATLNEGASKGTGRDRCLHGILSRKEPLALLAAWGGEEELRKTKQQGQEAVSALGSQVSDGVSQNKEGMLGKEGDRFIFGHAELGKVWCGLGVCTDPKLPIVLDTL
jgi:hypothetical protein